MGGSSVSGGTRGLKEGRRKTRRKGGYQGVLKEECGCVVGSEECMILNGLCSVYVCVYQ